MSPPTSTCSGRVASLPPGLRRRQELRNYRGPVAASPPPPCPDGGGTCPEPALRLLLSRALVAAATWDDSPRLSAGGRETRVCSFPAPASVSPPVSAPPPGGGLRRDGRVSPCARRTLVTHHPDVSAGGERRWHIPRGIWGDVRRVSWHLASAGQGADGAVFPRQEKPCRAPSGRQVAGRQSGGRSPSGLGDPGVPIPPCPRASRDLGKSLTPQAP